MTLNDIYENPESTPVLYCEKCYGENCFYKVHDEDFPNQNITEMIFRCTCCESSETEISALFTTSAIKRSEIGEEIFECGFCDDERTHITIITCENDETIFWQEECKTCGFKIWQHKNRPMENNYAELTPKN